MRAHSRVLHRRRQYIRKFCRLDFTLTTFRPSRCIASRNHEESFNFLGVGGIYETSHPLDSILSDARVLLLT